MTGNIVSINEIKDYFVEDSKIEELIKWLEKNGIPIDSTHSYDAYLEVKKRK